MEAVSTLEVALPEKTMRPTRQNGSEKRTLPARRPAQKGFCTTRLLFLAALGTACPNHGKQWTLKKVKYAQTAHNSHHYQDIAHWSVHDTTSTGVALQAWGNISLSGQSFSRPVRSSHSFLEGINWMEELEASEAFWEVRRRKRRIEKNSPEDDPLVINSATNLAVQKAFSRKKTC